MATVGMRGLNIFIQDVRNAANKEVEQERVDKELANIRKKITKYWKDLTSYDRKKCVLANPLPSRVRLSLSPLPIPRSRRIAALDPPRFAPFARGSGFGITLGSPQPSSSAPLPAAPFLRFKRAATTTLDAHRRTPSPLPAPLLAGTCGSSCTSSCSGTRWTSGTCRR